LISFAVQWLFTLGHAEVSLFTGCDTRADRFYSKLGWVRSLPDANNNVRFCTSAENSQ
jgi:hypothetical protein